VAEIEADDAGWEMESIIASRPSVDDHWNLLILVKWEEYSHNENTWENYENAAQC